MGIKSRIIKIVVLRRAMKFEAQLTRGNGEKHQLLGAQLSNKTCVTDE